MAFLDETGLAELWALIKAEDDSRVVTGSYTGTGKYGVSNPNTLTFDFAPKLVIILDHFSTHRRMIMIRGCTRANVGGSQSNYTSTVTWNGNSVSWYSTQTAASQMNSDGSDFNPYCYIAIG